MLECTAYVRLNYELKLGVVIWRGCMQCVDVSSCGNYCVIGYSSGHIDMFNMQSGLHRGTYANPTTGTHTLVHIDNSESG